MRGSLILLALSLAATDAALVQGARPGGLGASRRSAPTMFAPLIADVTPLHATAAAAATSALPTSVLVSDIADALQGFGNSPFVLLVPIGAGAALAAIIIFILVKSAG